MDEFCDGRLHHRQRSWFSDNYQRITFGCPYDADVPPADWRPENVVEEAEERPVVPALEMPAGDGPCIVLGPVTIDEGCYRVIVVRDGQRTRTEYTDRADADAAADAARAVQS